MKKIIGRAIKLILAVLSLVIIYLCTIILLGTITDYQPEDVSDLEITGDAIAKIIDDSTFTFLTWNIGYCGLGAEMDFFYDGGKMVRPTPELIKKYTSGVMNYLKSVDSIDFILLQEVDRNSARTRKQDEVQLIQSTLTKHASTYGANYKVQFVPLPFLNPLGKVEMGQMNLSKYQPEASHRYSYFSAYAWPKRLFMLDRCFVVSRFSLKNGKDLIILNTHNSAYDVGGKLREQEMPIISDLMIEEFEKGNYVVAGGDWNQNPPSYKMEKLQKTFQPTGVERLDSSLFPEGWQVVNDTDSPTNRSLDIPLTKGKTKVTLIDYFIVSPNVQVDIVKTLSQHFGFSDHEPVYFKIKLN